MGDVLAEVYKEALKKPCKCGAPANTTCAAFAGEKTYWIHVYRGDA